MLRGQKPQERQPRLKFLLYGPAGEGKTTAAVKMPAPYVIDTEDGTAHYGKTIEQSGGVVFPTTEFDDVIAEVRALATEQHDFRTLVIDSFTPLYDAKVDEGEDKYGTEFAAHHKDAKRLSKRLFSLVAALDMNVVVTAHSKAEYSVQKDSKGKATMVRTGDTFDGWKKLDYVFDLVFELKRQKNHRMAFCRKTRLPEFEDQESFEWSFEALAERYGADKLNREATQITFATEEQVQKINQLLQHVRVPEDWVSKCLQKVKADRIEDLTTDQAGKMIGSLQGRMPGAA